MSFRGVHPYGLHPRVHSGGYIQVGCIQEASRGASEGASRRVHLSGLHPEGCIHVVHPGGGVYPGGRGASSRHPSGRYASDWNAFLLRICR